MDGLRQWFTDWTQYLLAQITITSVVDVGLVFTLIYVVLLVIAERRTLWMVRGLIFLMLALLLSHVLKLIMLSYVLLSLVIGSAVAMAVILQSEARRFLEQLGRGQILQLLRPTQQVTPNPDNIVDEIVDAVKELSQSRTGALLIVENQNSRMDDRDFSVPGIKLNADISRELIQTIFQTSTLLHDGAVLIREDRIVSAGVILPISERDASRQLGTRHRAAMGITERVENCVCIVVSEETGSISLAEGGTLNRPLTSSKLKELLEEYLALSIDREVVTPNLRGLGREMREKSLLVLSRLLLLPGSRKKT